MTAVTCHWEVKGAVASRFRGTGQTCISANRLFVHSSVYDKFTSLLGNEARKLVVGNGMKEGVTQGPLINERAVKKVSCFSCVKLCDDTFLNFVWCLTCFTWLLAGYVRFTTKII